jgi:hypothetical protein
MIRPATPEDATEIARLGAVFHAQAGWSEIPYIAKDCGEALIQFMQMPNFLCFVAEKNEKIVGMIAGILSPVYFNHKHVSGEEIFWWVSKDAPPATGQKLLSNIEDSAKNLGCSTWQMKSLSRLNGDRMEKLYTRRGYRASERLFIKEL